MAFLSINGGRVELYMDSQAVANFTLNTALGLAVQCTGESRLIQTPVAVSAPSLIQTNFEADTLFAGLNFTAVVRTQIGLLLLDHVFGYVLDNDVSLINAVTIIISHNDIRNSSSSSRVSTPAAERTGDTNNMILQFAGLSNSANAYGSKRRNQSSCESNTKNL